MPGPDTCASPEQCRDTQWRQGHVLPATIAKALGFDPACHPVIISHDCDLAQSVEIEPEIEIIAAAVIDSANPAYRLAENPRLLHLEIEAENSSVNIELHATHKQLISKSALYALEFPKAPPHRAPLRLLQNWLACRYRRHALPNALNDRLSKAYSKLKDIAKKNSTGVIATWVRFDPDKEIGEDEPYEVSFTVVYESENPKGKEHAEAMANRLKSALKDAAGIDFGDAVAEADTSFTKFAERQMWEWRLEFISFRGNGDGALAERD